MCAKDILYWYNQNTLPYTCFVSEQMEFGSLMQRKGNFGEWKNTDLLGTSQFHQWSPFTLKKENGFLLMVDDAK